LDLIDKLLTLDPKKRITASEALDSEYFWTNPLPCDPSDIPSFPTSHEFQAKKRKQQMHMTGDALKRQRGPGGAPMSVPNQPSQAPKYPNQNYNQPPYSGRNPPSSTSLKGPPGPPMSTGRMTGPPPSNYQGKGQPSTSNSRPPPPHDYRPSAPNQPQK